MASSEFLSVEHGIELNNRLNAATQRALAATDERKTTKRIYDPRKQEFIVRIAFVRNLQTQEEG
jgi:hypothetical protein